MRALFRFVRKHPWWTGLAGIAIALAGYWGPPWWSERKARARKIPVLEAWIAAHPRPPLTAVPAHEDAAPLLRLAADCDTCVVGDEVFFPSEESTVPELEAWLAVNRDALATLESALKKPLCTAPLPEKAAGGMGSLMRLVYGRTLLLAAKGDRPGAVRSVLLAHRLLRFGGTFRFSSINIARIQVVRTLWPLLAQLEEPGLPEESLREILAVGVTPEESRRLALADMDSYVADWAEGFLEILRPGTQEPALVRFMREGAESAEEVRSLLERDSGSAEEDEGIFRRYFKPARRGSPLEITFAPSEIEEGWWPSIVYFEARSRLRGKGAVKALGPPPRTVEGVEGIYYIPVRFSVLYSLSLEGWLAVFRGAAAVRLFEVRSGTLPGGWDDIVPSILPAVPEDPFADTPLRFERTPEGVVLECSWPPDGNEEVPMGHPEGRGRRPRAVLRPAAAPK